MSDTPPPSTAPRQPERRRGFLGPLPIWAWIVAAAVLVALLVILGVALFAGGGGPSASRSPSPTPSSATPTPTPTLTPTATASPTATPPGTGPAASQGTFDSSMDNFLSETLDSQNTSVLSQGGTFSNPVFVIAANSDLSDNLTPDDAVNAMAFMLTPGDPNPWDLALSASTLAGYRAGPFGDYFPPGAIVARSSDGHVFSFIGDGTTISTMFLAASEDLLH